MKVIIICDSHILLMYYIKCDYYSIDLNMGTFHFAFFFLLLLLFFYSRKRSLSFITYCMCCGLQETCPYNSKSGESTNSHQQVSGVHEEGIIDQSQHYIWSVCSSFMNKNMWCYFYEKPWKNVKYRKYTLSRSQQWKIKNLQSA